MTLASSDSEVKVSCEDVNKSRREVNIIFQTLHLRPNRLRGQGQPRIREQSRREVDIIFQTLDLKPNRLRGQVKPRGCEQCRREVDIIFQTLWP